MSPTQPYGIALRISFSVFYFLLVTLILCCIQQCINLPQPHSGHSGILMWTGSPFLLWQMFIDIYLLILRVFLYPRFITLCSKTPVNTLNLQFGFLTIMRGFRFEVCLYMKRISPPLNLKWNNENYSADCCCLDLKAKRGFNSPFLWGFSE